MGDRAERRGLPNLTADTLAYSKQPRVAWTDWLLPLASYDPFFFKIAPSCYGPHLTSGLSLIAALDRPRAASLLISQTIKGAICGLPFAAYIPRMARL